MYILIFYCKNNREYLAIAVKCMEDGKNRISFIKDVEITDGKADTLYSFFSNEILKCGGVRLRSDGASIMIGGHSMPNQHTYFPHHLRF